MTAAQESDFEALCKAVGFIVINWSLMEQALDQCVAIIYQGHDGKRIQKELPRELNKKLEFLSRAFGRLPAMKPYKDEGLQITAKVYKLSPRRHDLVHGAIMQLQAVNGVIQFARFDFKGQKHHLRTVKFDVSEFPQFAKDLTELGGIVVRFAHRLANDFANQGARSA